MEPKAKIVLHTYRKKAENNMEGVIRISPQAESKLYELAAETGLSIRTIASELILQAAECATIVEG